MRDAEIKERLRDRNPWWRAPSSWAETDLVLREAAERPFVFTPEILRDISAPNLYTLIGPRRVGKSLALKRKIAETIAAGVPPRQIIYCSCDGFRRQDLNRMFKAGRGITPGEEAAPRWWFIDEITAVGDSWSEVIKELRDNTLLHQDCLVLTGSSSRGFRDAIDNLAGRRGPDLEHSDRMLLPMGFKQFCALTGVALPEDLPGLSLAELFSRKARETFTELSYWHEPLIEAWESYLRVGGYPRAVAEYIDHGEVSLSFARDLWDVVRGDAVKTALLSDLTVLSLLEQLGEGLASPSNASSLAKRLGLGSGHTALARVNDLVTNFLVWRCPQERGGSPNEEAMKKVYFTDPLLSRLASLIDDQRKEPEMSKLSEQQTGITLLRAIDRLHPGAFVHSTRLMYKRTKTKKEIDFVGPDLLGCVEGKYTDDGWKQEALTARANYSKALLASRRAHDLADPGIWITPAPALAWALDKSV